MDEIDHDMTDCIVCPHCGYKSEWESDNNEIFEEECGRCEKEYRVIVHHSVDFSTEIFDRAAEKREHDRKQAAARAADAVRYAKCQKFPPGTRVRVLETARYKRDRGKTGTIANRELSERHPCVYIDMDDRPSAPWPESFHPEEIEIE